MSHGIRVRGSIWAEARVADRVLNAGLELASSRGPRLFRRGEALTCLILLGELVAARSRKAVSTLVDGLARFSLLVWLSRVRVVGRLVGEVVVRSETVVSYREGLCSRSI